MENGHPQAEDNHPRSIAGAIIGLSLVALSFAIYIIKDPITRTLQSIVGPTLAIGLAILSGWISGKFKFSPPKKWGFIIASSGFGVFVFLSLTWHPVETDRTKHDITVFLSNEGNLISLDDIQDLVILFGSVPTKGNIDKVSKKISFPNVSSDFWQKTLRLELESCKWVFKSTERKSLDIHLDQEQMYVDVIPCLIARTIKCHLKRDGNPIPGVEAWVRDSANIRTVSDQQGFFSLVVPPSMTEDSVVLELNDGVGNVVEKRFKPGSEGVVVMPARKPLTKPVPPPISSHAGMNEKIFLSSLLKDIRNSRARWDIYNKDKTKLDYVEGLYNANQKTLSLIKDPSNKEFYEKYKSNSAVIQLRKYLDGWTSAFDQQKSGWPNKYGWYVVEYDHTQFSFPVQITNVLEDAIRKLN
jgi:hypothetical protein